MKRIELRLSSKISKIGHKVRSCQELITLSPQLFLEAMYHDNRYILSDECEEFIKSQTNSKKIFNAVIDVSNYRKQQDNEMKAKCYYTDSDNISMGNSTIILNDRISGIRCGF